MMTDAQPKVLENQKAQRGRGGRPIQINNWNRRHVVLLQTAAELFLAKGFEATSIDAIAQSAGVAKRFTSDARYTDKAELFLAAIARMI